METIPVKPKRRPKSLKVPVFDKPLTFNKEPMPKEVITRILIERRAELKRQEVYLRKKFPDMKELPDSTKDPEWR